MLVIHTRSFSGNLDLVLNRTSSGTSPEDVTDFLEKPTLPGGKCNLTSQNSSHHPLQYLIILTKDKNL